MVGKKLQFIGRRRNGMTQPENMNDPENLKERRGFRVREQGRDRRKCPSGPDAFFDTHRTTSTFRTTNRLCGGVL